MSVPELPSAAAASCDEVFTIRFAAARFELTGRAFEWSLEVPEKRVVLLNDEGAFVGLLLGAGCLLSGEAEVCGRPIAEVVAVGAVGVAPCLDPLPGGYSVRELLVLAGSLAGASRGEARAAAEDALAALGLEPLASRRAEALAETEKRWVHLARSVLRQPACIVVDRPLHGLDGARAAAVRAVLERACQNRRLVVLATPTEWQVADTSLIQSAGRVVQFVGGQVVRSGQPDAVLRAPSQYTVVVADNAAAFHAALGERGIRVTGGTNAAAGAAARFLVEAPGDAELEKIVDAAVSAAAPVVQLVAVDQAEERQRHPPIDGDQR